MPPLPATLGLPPHRSVLRLGPGSRLVGLGAESGVAVEDLPPALAAMLDELTAPVPTAELVERAVARGGCADRAEALLHDLVEAGALVDAAGVRRRDRVRAASTVIVRGDGPLAAGVVLGLARAGVGAVHVEASGRVRDADLGTGLVDADLGTDRFDAITAALGRLSPQTATGRPPQGLEPDLVVLADAAPQPAEVLALHVAGTPHLLAVLREGAGVVGPLVLPARTACLGCLELHRTAADPSWPVVAAQLAGRPGRGDPACALATAGLATAQALAALDGGAAGAAPPTALEATLELDGVAGTITRRTWPPRPECRCGASSRRREVGRATGW